MFLAFVFVICLFVIQIIFLKFHDISQIWQPRCAPIGHLRLFSMSNVKRLCSNVNMGGVMFISVDSVIIRNDLTEYSWLTGDEGKMVMLETYYHLAEKDISRVSSIWKGMSQLRFVYIFFLSIERLSVGHVTLLAAIAISGFITAYTFGNTLDAFGNHCIIFSNVKLVERNVTDGTNDANATVNSSTPARFFRNDNETLTISLKKTVWGSDAMCSFCQFTPVMSMIFALSWGVFFTICSRGGSGYPSDM